MYYKDNRIISKPGKRLTVNGRTVFNPRWNHYEEAGWKPFPEELQSVPRHYIKWVDKEPIEMSEEEKAARKPSLEDQLEEVAQLRRAAYQEESDPIFFMWQRGEATEEDWLEKILEIKVRYPKPEVEE